MLVIVAGTVAAYLLASSGAFRTASPSPSLPPFVIALLVVCDVLLAVIGYYAIAAAVRTVHPDYRMTVGQFFGILGYGLLSALLTGAASICFVVPGWWIGIKVLFTPYTYAVTNGAPGALKTTWNMTTGYWWQTFGLLLLAGLCIGVLFEAAFWVAWLVVRQAPMSAVLVAPLCLALLIWLIHVQALVYVRWANGLLPRAGAPQGLAVTA